MSSYRVPIEGPWNTVSLHGDAHRISVWVCKGDLDPKGEGTSQTSINVRVGCRVSTRQRSSSPQRGASTKSELRGTLGTENVDARSQPRPPSPRQKPGRRSVEGSLALGIESLVHLGGAPPYPRLFPRDFNSRLTF